MLPIGQMASVEESKQYLLCRKSSLHRTDCTPTGNSFAWSKCVQGSESMLHTVWYKILEWQVAANQKNQTQSDERWV